MSGSGESLIHAIPAVIHVDVVVKTEPATAFDRIAGYSLVTVPLAMVSGAYGTIVDNSPPIVRGTVHVAEQILKAAVTPGLKTTRRVIETLPLVDRMAQTALQIFESVGDYGLGVVESRMLPSKQAQKGKVATNRLYDLGSVMFHSMAGPHGTVTEAAKEKFENAMHMLHEANTKLMRELPHEASDAVLRQPQARIIIGMLIMAYENIRDVVKQVAHGVAMVPSKANNFVSSAMSPEQINAAFEKASDGFSNLENASVQRLVEMVHNLISFGKNMQESMWGGSQQQQPHHHQQHQQQHQQQQQQQHEHGNGHAQPLRGYGNEHESEGGNESENLGSEQHQDQSHQHQRLQQRHQHQQHSEHQ